MAVNIKKGSKKKPDILVHELQVRSVDRTPKDIAKMRQAHIAAENVYFPNRVALYNLYDEIMLDGHLTGIIGKRDDAVLNKVLHFVKGKEKIDAMDALIESEAFRGIMKAILETPRWGISGLEFLPGTELAYEIVPRKHIKPEIRVIAREENGREGYSFDDYPNVWIIGGKKDLGLLLKCAPLALYKRGNWGDWATYVEQFGIPIRVIKYDATDEQTKVELKEILDESGSALALMIPNQAEFDIKDGKQSNGDGKLQDTLKEALNAELSVIILGNTETTTNGGTGSQAKSEIHQEQQLEVTKSDLKYVANMLNSPQFFAILQSYGYPVEGGKFVFAKEVDLKQIKEQLSIAKSVKDMGVPVADDYIYEVSGIPRPDNYDELKAAALPTEEPDDVPLKKPKKKAGKPQSMAEQAGAIAKLMDWAKNFFVPAPAAPGHLMNSLHVLYADDCQHGLHIPMAADDEFTAIVERIAAELYGAKLTDGHIPQDLYSKTAGILFDAIQEGLGGSSFAYGDPDNKLKAYLQHNVHAFSAAKSLAEMQHYRSLLTDADGKPRSKSDYRNACTDAGYVFNNTYLESERVNAIATAQSAQQFESFAENEWIQISTAGDNKVRPEHAKLDRFTAPKNDPIWLKLCPPFDWGCRCVLIPGVASKASKVDKGQMMADAKIPKYFQRNPAINREVFSNGHTYYLHAGKKLKELTGEGNYNMPSVGKLYADNDFPLPVEVAGKDEANKWWQSNAGSARGHIFAQDVSGNTLRFSNDFRNHVFEDNKDERWKYIANCIDVVKQPDEVWSFKEKGILKKVYLKYYENFPMLVKVDECDAVTFYALEKGGKMNISALGKLRRGALLYRK